MKLCQEGRVRSYLGVVYLKEAHPKVFGLTLGALKAIEIVNSQLELKTIVAFTLLVVNCLHQHASVRRWSCCPQQDEKVMQLAVPNCKNANGGSWQYVLTKEKVGANSNKKIDTLGEFVGMTVLINSNSGLTLHACDHETKRAIWVMTDVHLDTHYSTLNEPNIENSVLGVSYGRKFISEGSLCGKKRRCLSLYRGRLHAVTVTWHHDLCETKSSSVL
ncbi:unnamed protein product [Dovyalis caffra]|uniref:Uncharacterized protein n=1 Tax=Dovyalis caffra TaxID=77055 RepID=A0AAV1S1P3_9ROSI|nr:unnamed protein product [Dovyalis caffra]